MIPFVGPSAALDVARADVQRSINLFPVANEVIGGKSGSYLAPVPGLSEFSIASAVNDAHFLDVVLLLLADGPIGATAAADYFDYSRFHHTPTMNGAIQEAGGPFGTGAFRVSPGGSASAMWYPTLPEFVVGTADFTWECWFKLDSVPASVGFLVFNGNNSAFTNRAGIGAGPASNGGIAWYTNGSATAAQTGVDAPTGVWIFVAYSRTAGRGRLWVNGVQAGPEIADATNYPASPGISLGGTTDSAFRITGQMGPTRLTHGFGRYPFACPVPDGLFPTY